MSMGFSLLQGDATVPGTLESADTESPGMPAPMGSTAEALTGIPEETPNGLVMEASIMIAMPPKVGSPKMPDVGKTKQMAGISESDVGSASVSLAKYYKEILECSGEEEDSDPTPDPPFNVTPFANDDKQGNEEKTLRSDRTGVTAADGATGHHGHRPSASSSYGAIKPKINIEVRIWQRLR